MAVLARAVVVISIHALREEDDRANALSLADGTIFLSTPSARRATDGLAFTFPHGNISIHALREEGDISLYSV